MAAFALADNPGLSVNVDDEDNEAGHAILHSDSGIMVSFTVFNVGNAAGSCTVELAVDNELVETWTSYDIQPQGSESAEVKGLGRYPAGWYDFVATVKPAAEGYAGQLRNNVNVIDP